MSNVVFANEIKLPPMPKSDNGTLVGVDTNKNFVRDDVEHFIYETISKEPGLYKAYMNMASNYSHMLLETDEEVLHRYKTANNKIGKCLGMYYRENAGKNSLDIQSLVHKIFNNEKRLKKLKENNKKIRGGMDPSSDAKSIKELCT